MAPFLLALERASSWVARSSNEPSINKNDAGSETLGGSPPGISPYQTYERPRGLSAGKGDMM
jgi:hypothetical protein